MKKMINFLGLAIALTVLNSCGKDDPTPAPDPTTTFQATLSGANEVPANASTFTGTATLVFNTNTKIFTVTVNHNVTAPTNGHIHQAAIGVNGPVIFPFASPWTSPITYTSAALDATQEGILNSNGYYVNIHTAAFPGGEIRGQLIKQ